MAKTEISWADVVFNPVTGCSHESAGCTFCYAENVSRRFRRTFKPWTANNISENLAIHRDRYPEPVKLKKPSVIFTCSMGDLYHPEIDLDELAAIHGFMIAARRHRFLALTKRPARALEFFKMYSPIDCWKRAAASYASLPPIEWSQRFDWSAIDWLWLGTSAEDQRNYDLRIPKLLDAPVAHRFISAEPLLGALDLKAADLLTDEGAPLIDWVIAGGESGGSAPRSLLAPTRAGSVEPRPDRLEWVRSIRDQCDDYGIAFTFKQWGGQTHASGGRILDGRTYDANPARDSLTQTDPLERAQTALF